MVQIEAEKDAFTGPHEVASLRCEFERPRSPSGAPDAEDECIGAAFERMTADLLAEFAHLKEVMIDSFDSTERLLRGVSEILCVSSFSKITLTLAPQ